MQPFAPGFPMRFPGQAPRSAGSAPFNCDADRVLTAGGALSELLMPPGVTPLQWTFRKSPTPGVYEATREKPYQFVLGTFVVPKEMTLALAEYRFRPYRFSGVIAGEPIPLEDRRESLSIGYDLTTATAGRQGNLSTEIMPGAPGLLQAPAFPQMQTGGTVFPGLPTSGSPLGTVSIATIYGVTEINDSADPQIAAGLKPPAQQPAQFVTTLFGSSMLPQSQKGQQGPEKLPFTYYINENDNVTLTVGVFSPVQIPLAFFEGVLSGYLMSKVALAAMLEKMKPCSST